MVQQLYRILCPGSHPGIACPKNNNNIKRILHGCSAILRNVSSLTISYSQVSETDSTDSCFLFSYQHVSIVPNSIQAWGCFFDELFYRFCVSPQKASNSLFIGTNFKGCLIPTFGVLSCLVICVQPLYSEGDVYIFLLNQKRVRRL